jgi:hypothetical protein
LGAALSGESFGFGEIFHEVLELNRVSGWQIAALLETFENVGAKMDLVEVDLHLGAIWVLLLLHAVQADRLDIIDGDWVIWVKQLGRS